MIRRPFEGKSLSAILLWYCAGVVLMGVPAFALARLYDIHSLLFGRTADAEWIAVDEELRAELVQRLQALGYDGEFKNGHGEFFSQETLNERPILVRFVISDITPDSCRFEQAFSDDGGKTWEVNWIAIDTRLENETD